MYMLIIGILVSTMMLNLAFTLMIVYINTIASKQKNRIDGTELSNDRGR